MTIALATIGCIIVILGAAAKIPPAAAAFVRACIPLVTAIHDLCEAMHRHRSHPHASHGNDAGVNEASEADPSGYVDGVHTKPGEYDMV